jgi:hypothetical protein
MVRKTVPLAPLAQATFSETALMPRSGTSVRLFCGVWAQAKYESSSMIKAAATRISMLPKDLEL